MLIPDRTSYLRWLSEYFAEQIKTRSMTREEAAAHIRAAADRAIQAGSQNPEAANAAAQAMIAALPRAPDNDRAD